MATPARRLRRLRTAEVLGLEVPVASGAAARLLGLSHLDLAQAGSGLLIPRCAGVHTFGMRFALDLVFLGRDGRPCSLRKGVPSRRAAWDSCAGAVLELPCALGLLEQLAAG
ncbi:MAG TPA: DUF192 domain-containing protein [Solirubrobacterales bacterium]